MKPFILAMVPASLLLLATPVVSADVAPGDVKYDEGAVAASLTGVAGDPAAGEKIMTTRKLGNCIACHEVTALKKAPFHGNIGPSLDGVADRYSEAHLRGIVANAKMTFDGSMMPSFYKQTGYIRPGDGFTGKAGKEPLPPLLSAQEIEDVVAFLKTLK